MKQTLYLLADAHEDIRFVSYLMPIPITTPAVTKRPPIFRNANPLNISPSPRQKIPKRPAIRVPILRMTPALMIPKNEIQAGAREPTNDRVDDDDTPSLTRAACKTPQQYAVPVTHQVTIAHPEITTQPLPPSGTWESARRDACMALSEGGAAVDAGALSCLS